MVDKINHEDQEIMFKVYVKEIEKIFLKDFSKKPTYFYKRVNNYSDFKTILKINKVKPISPLEVFYKVNYDKFHKISNDEEKCSICMDLIYEFDFNSEFSIIKEMDKKLNHNYNVCLFEKCIDHFFHIDCVKNMIGSNDFIKCPICTKIYGKLTGTQPPGTMKVNFMRGTFCDSYKCDTICINYYFPDGNGYSGTSRTAYIPDTKEGIKVLGLLKEAFDRRLIFTIGTSVTNGSTNTTVWAGIHHKTSLSGGTSNYGFPDPTYLTRVQEELACKGVTEDTMKESPEQVAFRLLGIKTGKGVK